MASRTVRWLLLLAAVPVAATASPRTLSVQQAYDEICGGPHALPLEIAGSRQFVTITLKGPKKTEAIRFHVDTGGNTPGVMLPKSVATRLGFESEDTLPTTLRIGSEDVKLPDGAAWTLFDDTNADGAKEAEFDRGTRKNFAPGQLGAGFLSRFVVCIDPAKGRLGLADPHAISIVPAANEPTSIPLILQIMDGDPDGARYPFIFVLMGKTGLGVLLDTGATTSMLEKSILERLLKEHPEWPSAQGAAGDADMHGGLREIRMMRAADVTLTFPTRALARRKLKDAPKLVLGSVLFEEQPNGTFESMFGSLRYTGGAYGAVANDVLGHYRLLIDYSESRLWLEPINRTPDLSASEVRVGVALRFNADGCPQITRVTDSNAPTTREQLHVDDILVAVDGHDTCKAWHHEISTWLAGTSGATKQLKIKRGGRSLTVKVPVVDLLAR